MLELHLPWLELCVLIPALGAAWVATLRDPVSARRSSLVASGLALACSLAAWQDFALLHTRSAHDLWDPLSLLFGEGLLVIDELTAPLLPMAALICFLTNLATLRTKVREFSFARSLASESILLATLSCARPWALVALLAVATVPPLLELRARRRPIRVFAMHMALFVSMLVAGQVMVGRTDGGGISTTLGVSLLSFALLLRVGIVPVHCWMTDLFEHVTFGTALLFVSPMVGAYGMARLVLPVAPQGILEAISIASMGTAVYAAGMALVQREARRFFCFLFLSHSSLVLVGLETATPIGLTGALSLWLSIAMALTGFGLVMRCVESRIGRISLADFHGLDAHVPMLAALFLLTGLASIGFPGTAGFVGLELLVEAASRTSPILGASVVVVAALNGLAVMQAFFRIFTGRPNPTSIDLRIRPPERIAVLALTALILGGGLLPQPGVSSRHRAALELAESRQRLGQSVDPAGEHSRHGSLSPPAPIPSTLSIGTATSRQEARRDERPSPAPR
jgi:NADH-quinone oxidoreductase subunit M